MPVEHILCAPGAHIGEQIARAYLVEHLATSRGILLTNYHHPSGNGTDEHDLVLINEGGVWAVEVKHWTGRIDADQISWLHNGIKHPSPMITIEGKAKSIASTVREAGFTNVSVVGLVVLTRNDTRFGSEPPEDHRRKLFRLNDRLLQAVTGTEYRYRSTNRDLTPTEIQRIADLLVKRKVDPEQQIIGSYRLVQEIETNHDYRVYEAQHTRIESRRARVKRYQATGYTSRQELTEAARRFQRDIDALSQIENHPNIVRAFDFMADADTDDTYWLLLEWVEGQTVRDRLNAAEPIDFEHQLDILRPLTSALAACHKHGILHRNITPESVYLADDGAVKLGDFDFARVSSAGRTISKTGVPLTVNKYLAQELRGGFRAADERSDLYALGAIWYDMAVREPADFPIIPANIDDTTIPSDAKDMLRSLLAPQPQKRPTSAEEVYEWLTLLS